MKPAHCGTELIKQHQTKWPELQYGHYADVWRFFNEGAVVGPLYPTKETLLADMNRYAERAWGLT